MPNDQEYPEPVDQERLNNLAIVLVEPKYPENIGAAARVALNMGIADLVVVRSQEPDRAAMLKMATHKAAHLIENLVIHKDLGEALAPYNFVIGASARHGRQRNAIKDPRSMAEEIVPMLADNRVALLFGPENHGLTTDDLQYCQMTMTIPTASFSSLNLAQAVAVCCYEIFSTLRQHQGKQNFTPKLANTHEREEMFAHLEKMLLKIGFLNTNDPTYWMRNIRAFLGRYQLRSREVRIIRGFCRQLLWHGSQPLPPEVENLTNKDENG